MEERDKNNENFNENKASGENSLKDSLQVIFDIINTTFAPLKTLIKIHYKFAIREFKKDSERLISALFSIFLGLFFFLTVWILLNALGIIALYEFLNLKLFYAILIVTGINLIFTVILFLIAIPKFKKPIMKDTKQMIKETVQDLNK